MRELWEKFFPGIKSSEKKETKVPCPFCRADDETFQIQIEEDTFKCAACGAEGNFKQFQTQILGDLTQREFFEAGGVREIPPQYIQLSRIETYQKHLAESEKWKEFLAQERLIDAETIKKFHLGSTSKRIIIPIFDIDDKRILNLRKYDPFDKKGYKMLSEKGFGETLIFPARNLKGKKSLLFLEGEMDTILGCQMGYNAITFTTGISTRLPDQYLKHFKNREISICFDLQEVSNIGARRLKDKLKNIAKKINIIYLFDSLGEKGDFTDFFRAGFKKEDFDKLLAEEIKDVTLENLVDAEHLNYKVRVVGKISGKDEIPFLIPEIVSFHCRSGGSKKDCVQCALFPEGQEIRISEDDPINLELIMCSAQELKRSLASLWKIPKGCKGFIDIEVKEGRNVEGLRIVPEKLVVGSGKFVTRHAYYLGEGLLANRIYEFEGIVIPEPRQQYASFLVEQARTEENPLDAIDTDFSALKIFQAEGRKITEKLAELSFFLQQNVTKMYGRGDILQAVNMAFFTPISFPFQNDLVQRGWADVLILGDSRQGKTKTVERLFEYYNLGEVVSGEKATIAGLKGGCSQVGKTWHLQWGLIPLNDRGILGIDAVESMEADVFSALSRIRSEGIAELVMIRTEKTLARTRLIFITNPIEDRPLLSWSYPIEAVKRFGKLADLARFDFVITAGDGEVSLDEMKKGEEIGEIEDKYPRKLWRQLIIWAWSRKPEDIVFEAGIEDYIFEVAKELSETYRSPIPIVKETEERYIIAKYAISVASQLFSTDEEMQQIIVNDAHVDFVKNFFIDIFGKESCGYDQYALINQRLETLANTDAVRNLINEHGGLSLIEAFLQKEKLAFSDFQDLLGLEKSTVRHIIGELVRNRAISRTHVNYYKSPPFIKLLKEMRAGIPF